MKKNQENKVQEIDNINNYKHKFIVASVYIIGLIVFTKCEYKNYLENLERIKQKEQRRKARRNVK